MSREKLLLLSTTSKIGGTERMVLALALDVQKLGYEVQTVLAQDDGVEATLRWFEHEGVQASASSAVPTIYQHRTLRSFVELRELVRRSGATAVNIHYGGSHFSLRDVAAIRASGVRKCVVSVHHTNHISALRHRLMTRLGAHVAHAIVVTTDVAKEVLTAANVPGDRIHVVAPSVKAPGKLRSREEARQRLGLAPDLFVVGCLARLDLEKGIHDVIEALGRIPDPEQRMRLVVTGDGDARAELERLAAERLGARALFTGRLEEAADLYAAADVFALPSYMEGFGLVYIEAAYYGVPSIATRVGGVPFAIKDGETGILIDVRDVEALRRAVVRLRDDPELRKRMGDAARARAEREFSGRMMSEKYCRILFPN